MNSFWDDVCEVVSVSVIALVILATHALNWSMEQIGILSRLP